MEKRIEAPRSVTHASSDPVQRPSFWIICLLFDSENCSGGGMSLIPPAIRFLVFGVESISSDESEDTFIEEKLETITSGVNPPGRRHSRSVPDSYEGWVRH
jgi:hypothetical protein